MARRTKEDALKTRESIIDAAIELFASKGVSSTTLANIATKAGVTRGAVYWHFSNKDALIEALKDMVLEPFKVKQAILDDPDLDDPMGLLFETQLSFFENLEKNKRVVKILKIFLIKYENSGDMEQVFVEKASCHLHKIERLETFLAKAIDKGQLPADFNTRMGAIAIISFIDGLIHNYILFPNTLSCKREIPQLLKGLSTMLENGM